ncbi:MAG: phenylacetate--CoA ligase family protein [Roseovarius sp.]|nr:phenylacetate--CoA ligase family protein [Roseovarius sp.]MCY4208908.1 phenylacetate--CoA ligase family protein [Roseovarius sp.]MCY4292033.1 phenylacetate--CoA ligase family protein [Roseovarius sp.]
MSGYYDDLEIRSADQREADHLSALNRQLEVAKVDGFEKPLQSLDELARLPLLRKSELIRMQAENLPFGGIPVNEVAHVFQSPGPIYEPGGISHDWWRMGRFLHALGIGKDDIIQNCFSYHLTPAGMIFENGAQAVGARVLPAGPGQTELQVKAASEIGVTGYAGTPDFLKIILDKAEETGRELKISKAAVGGGALFPSLREEYADRGIVCRQCYATADIGNIAYESEAMEGMIVDEGVIVEIVTPGTGIPVTPGQVGEVVVTTFNPDYPLIRFATGDLSASIEGASPCGRTNIRIKGWMGRADQTTKIKGMFVRPEQVASLMSRHEEIVRARVVVTRKNEKDAMIVKVETDRGNAEQYKKSVGDLLKLNGRIEIVPVGSLPNDGLVIEDARSYD